MITPPPPYPYQVEFFESEFDTHGMFLLSSSKRASGRFSRVVPNIFYVLIIVQIKISARHHQKSSINEMCSLCKWVHFWSSEKSTKQLFFPSSFACLANLGACFCIQLYGNNLILILAFLSYLKIPVKSFEKRKVFQFFFLTDES